MSPDLTVHTGLKSAQWSARIRVSKVLIGQALNKYTLKNHLRGSINGNVNCGHYPIEHITRLQRLCCAVFTGAILISF